MTLFFYRILILIFIPLAFLRLIFKSFSNKDLLCHWREHFGFCAPEGLKNKKLIWIHAVSVGETNAINPLVSKILKEHKDVNLLITHGTLTGRQTPLKSSTRIIRRYLPYDNSWMMKKFLSNYSPDIGLIVETEIWPNLFFESFFDRAYTGKLVNYIFPMVCYPGSRWFATCPYFVAKINYFYGVIS